MFIHHQTGSLPKPAVILILIPLFWKVWAVLCYDNARTQWRKNTEENNSLIYNIDATQILIPMNFATECMYNLDKTFHCV